jgi:hypothetical protein
MAAGRNDAVNHLNADAERQSAPLLQGRSHEDVLARAHDFGERQLRRLLHSL